MPRYKLTLEYNGTGFAGWQRQNDRITVQQALEEALEKFCGAQIYVCGAGRTDAGVHAAGQVAHIDMPKEYDPYQIMMGMNFYMHAESDSEITQKIAVTACEPVSDEFHARFSATKRHYLYRILNRRAVPALERERVWHVPEPLDPVAMQKAANLLLGKHDFTSFRDTQCQAKSPEKTLEVFTIMPVGGEIYCFLSSRSFLHHQVRIMVGTMRLVGAGKWTVDDVKKALAARDRRAGGPTAPPEGLYLMGVEY